MAQEREIATRIVSLGELQEIVGAIRASAASQMQQALRSLDAIRRYSETLREALSDAVKMLPTDEARPESTEIPKSGLIVFCGEHGLCGAFNERPLRVVEEIAKDRRKDLILVVVGSRGGQRCGEQGIQPDVILPMATHCASVTAAARRLTTTIYRKLSDDSLATLEVVYSRSVTGEPSRIERHRLLPLAIPNTDRQTLEPPPLINLPAHRLFDDVVAEYFFAALENAAMESFFSENSARFRTMEAAHRNISNKTRDLTNLARRLRQESVTTEILDLISGVQAESATEGR
jgi:F-type H+-transporting ATPase subunit gamma